MPDVPVLEFPFVDFRFHRHFLRWASLKGLPFFFFYASIHDITNLSQDSCWVSSDTAQLVWLCVSFSSIVRHSLCSGSFRFSLEVFRSVQIIVGEGRISIFFSSCTKWSILQRSGITGQQSKSQRTRMGSIRLCFGTH